MNINLKKIIEAIRLRKSHSNIMWPGLGVGGYCLTKDPSFVKFSMKKFFKRNIKFPIVDTSSLINKNMFKTSLSFILENIKTLNRKKVLICGITYREDTNDMRYSPAVDLLKAMKSKAQKFQFMILFILPQIIPINLILSTISKPILILFYFV